MLTGIQQQINIAVLANLKQYEFKPLAVGDLLRLQFSSPSLPSIKIGQSYIIKKKKKLTAISILFRLCFLSQQYC